MRTIPIIASKHQDKQGMCPARGAAFVQGASGGNGGPAIAESATAWITATDRVPADGDGAPRAGGDAAGAGSGRGVRYGLRAKGLIALFAGAAFVGALGMHVASERQKLFDAFVAVERIDRDDQGIAAARFRLSGALARTEGELLVEVGQPNARDVAAGIESAVLALREVGGNAAALVATRGELQRAMEIILADPARTSLVQARDALRSATAELDRLSAAVRDERSNTVSGFFRRFSALTATWLAMALAGLAVIGAFMTVFFARLATDLRRLEERSQEIVRGYRGDPLSIRRTDEVGGLATAVNQMADDLRVRERQLALSQQQYLHREKMAAVGSLAAGVAHEIGNPIAAIAGVAQEMCEVKATIHCEQLGMTCHPELILQQTQRVAGITRQISEFAAQRSPDPEYLDLNALMESTCNFVRYDHRFRGIALVLEPDRTIPAVFGVADHLVQVLMNLLINAADACLARTDVAGRVVVATGARSAVVFLRVADNGCGMDEAVRARAFEAFFTTKSPGKGTGLGLAMCRTLVDAMGGRIELDSRVYAGTQVLVELPESEPVRPRPGYPPATRQATT